MKVKAVKGFSGERFGMYAGEVREVEETQTVKELLRIGYLESAEVEPVTEEAPAEVKPDENKRGKSKRN